MGLFILRTLSEEKAREIINQFKLDVVNGRIGKMITGETTFSVTVYAPKHSLPGTELKAIPNRILSRRVDELMKEDSSSVRNCYNVAISSGGPGLRHFHKSQFDAFKAYFKFS